MPAVSHENVVDLVITEIESMAAVCRGADPATPVPTCPEWDLAELIRHTGTGPPVGGDDGGAVLAGAAPARRHGLGRARGPQRPPRLAGRGRGASSPSGSGPADPATPMWAWGWPKTAGFWPRRMLHETGVHRSDAELALGRTPDFDPEVAADGVSELLDNLPHAAYFAPRRGGAEGRGRDARVRRPRPRAAWAIELGRDGFSWTRDGDDGGGAAAATLETLRRRTAPHLYGRRPVGPDEVTGDRTLVERWIEQFGALSAPPSEPAVGMRGQGPQTHRTLG